MTSECSVMIDMTDIRMNLTDDDPLHPAPAHSFFSGAGCTGLSMGNDAAPIVRGGQ